jgi:hypothetical protein
MDPISMLMFVPSLVQTATGLFQSIKGNKIDDIKRPERTTPQALTEAAAIAKNAYTAGRRPGSAEARERISGNQAGAVSQIQKAGGSATSTLAAALGAQKQADYSNIEQDVMDSQFNLSSMNQYLDVLNRVAQEQGINFEWNEAQKYQEDANAARYLKESGLQNIMGGLSEGAGLGYAMSKLNPNSPKNSPYYNQSKGYMGTQEQFDASNNAAMAKYKNAINPNPVAPSNPMHGKFGEGMNTSGYLSSTNSQIQPMPPNNNEILSNLFKYFKFPW